MSASHKTLDCVERLMDAIDKLPLESKKDLVKPSLELLESLANDAEVHLREVKTELSKLGSKQNDTI